MSSVTLRNVSGWKTLTFTDGTSIAPGAVATVNLDPDMNATETTGDRNFSAQRREVEFYVRNGEAAIVGPDV